MSGIRVTWSGFSISNTSDGLNHILVVHVVRLTNIVLSEVLESTTWGTIAEASFALVSIIVVSGTVVYVLYLGVRAVIVTPGVLEHNLVLAASIWSSWTWFIVAVEWKDRVWVVLTDVVCWGWFIVASEPELSRLGYWVTILCWTLWLGEPDIGFLWRCIGVILCEWWWWIWLCWGWCWFGSSDGGTKKI